VLFGLQIHHAENKFTPFTLASLINEWRRENSSSAALSDLKATSSVFDFISGVSGEIGSQLHDGIMKAARRFLLDEIIGNVIVDFVAMKKVQKQRKNEHATENLKACALDGEKVPSLYGLSSPLPFAPSLSLILFFLFFYKNAFHVVLLLFCFAFFK